MKYRKHLKIATKKNQALLQDREASPLDLWGLLPPWRFMLCPVIKTTKEETAARREAFTGSKGNKRKSVKEEFRRYAEGLLKQRLPEELLEQVLSSEVHHILPLALGGRNNIENLALVPEIPHIHLHMFMDNQTAGLKKKSRQYIWIPYQPTLVWSLDLPEGYPVPTRKKYLAHRVDVGEISNSVFMAANKLASRFELLLPVRQLSIAP